MRPHESKLCPILKAVRRIQLEGVQDSCVSLQSIWSTGAWNPRGNPRVRGKEFPSKRQIHLVRKGSRQRKRNSRGLFLFEAKTSRRRWNEGYSVELCEILGRSRGHTVQTIRS
eukprot:CCRYP_013296-RA/>CCRYP_013296-RA protein AED:0.16 eAED:0.16 QI:543/1/1/1/1/1/2/606/112